MATQRLFVVYQMGKVASVSIAETLAAIAGAEVQHCHYLAKNTIEASLTKALNPDFSQETYWHTSRQMLSNLDLHRRIRQIESGMETGVELCLITLAREPLAWARSNLVQNLFEHEAIFRRICTGQGIRIDERGDWLGWAITRTVDNIGRLCAEGGTIVQVARQSPAQIRDCLDCSHDEALVMKRMAGIFRRPHEWFAEEFQQFTGLSLDCLDEIAPQVRFGRMGTGSAYAIRFEDLPVSFDMVMDHLGLGHVRLTRFANVSSEKPGAEAMRKAFAETPYRNAIEAASVTGYTRRFGYDYASCRNQPTTDPRRGV
ncbi:MAG: hypothetical protein DWI03_04415 [Planctomycetota bacterium]|nr:MAG: hypothetical protein DWI03_04415 [Planctomycetota bacterium]